MNGAVAVAVLLLVVAGSIGIVILVRRRTGRIEAGLSAEFATVLYGLLLGLLLVGANDHYDSARQAAATEATAASAVVVSSIGLPETDRVRIQHDAICVMRATVDREWPTLVTDADGSPPVHAAIARLIEDSSALARSSDPVSSARSAALVDRAVALSVARDDRVDHAYTAISPALWVIAFLGAGIVVVLTGIGVSESNRRRWVVAMIPMVVLLISVFYVLAAVDNPYTGVFFRVSPASMQQTIADITADHPAAGVLAACP